MTPPNLTLLKASAGLILVGLLCASSTRVYRKKRTWSSAFQLAGACLLLVVVAIHICEPLHLLASMDWEPRIVPAIIWISRVRLRA